MPPDFFFIYFLRVVRRRTVSVFGQAVDFVDASKSQLTALPTTLLTLLSQAVSIFMPYQCNKRRLRLSTQGFVKGRIHTETMLCRCFRRSGVLWAGVAAEPTYLRRSAASMLSLPSPRNVVPPYPWSHIRAHPSSQANAISKTAPRRIDDPYPMAELNRESYTVAWIAPLEIEARAALLMLDKTHSGRFVLGRGDDYVFSRRRDIWT